MGVDVVLKRLAGYDWGEFRWLYFSNELTDKWVISGIHVQR